MPTHYQELIREEMEYVDGGGTIYTWMVSGTLDVMFLAKGATTGTKSYEETLKFLEEETC